MVIGTSSGAVSMISIASDALTPDNAIYESVGKRQCTALGWNKCQRNLLASGFEKSRNNSSDIFCFGVWDVVKCQMVYKSTIEEPTTAISWLPYDPSLVAVGTSISYLRLYDVRVSSNEAVASIIAHPSTRPKKVKGIRCDPFNSHILATFSDSPAENVKVWDLRKGSKARLTIMPYDNIGSEGGDGSVVSQYIQVQQQAVIDVAWSEARSNHIAVATTHSKYVSFYGTSKASIESTIRVPLHSIPIADSIKALSWQALSSYDINTSIGGSNRLLVATMTGFQDIKVIESVGLGLGVDGTVAASVGNKMCIANASYSNTDIESIMKLRVTSGYSIDPGKNLQVLADEIEGYKDETVEASSSNASNDLYRIWEWVERLESILDTEDIQFNVCGVMHLLSLNKASVFDGCGQTHRSRARVICGWYEDVIYSPCDSAMNDELMAILEEVEVLHSFERAATLALWHGYPQLAVKFLQESIDCATDSCKNESSNYTTTLADCTDELELGSVYSDNVPKQCYQRCRAKIYSKEYLHLVSLVSMCIAGFPAITCSNATTSMWITMCDRVLKQLRALSIPSPYLLAACNFLVENLLKRADSEESKYESILSDQNLVMEDRIAFAVTFLADKNLTVWLESTLDACKKTGMLEGLIISGLNSDGVSIIQEYVDKTSDIQTAALLVARSISSNDIASISFARELYWLSEYRNLLNTWQLYIARASLDVEIGKRRREVTQVSKTEARISTVSSYHGSRGVSVPIDRKSSSVRVMYTLPPHNSDMPHVFLRCHYCSSSLPADAMQLQQAAFLRKQQSILHCCPNCKKPLPRCYVCQLYMGLVNPHAEFNKAMQQKRTIGVMSSITNSIVNSSGDIDHAVIKNDHNVLEFGRWFFFCQNCKHGGHALCIDAWFDGSQGGRHICGVNGCNCLCSMK